jgi:hypothetical protein
MVSHGTELVEETIEGIGDADNSDFFRNGAATGSEVLF